MKPGDTAKPDASTVRCAVSPASLASPMKTIRPPAMPTSPRLGGVPVPSTIVPPVISTSSIVAPYLGHVIHEPDLTSVEHSFFEVSASKRVSALRLSPAVAETEYSVDRTSICIEIMTQVTASQEPARSAPALTE